MSGIDVRRIPIIGEDIYQVGQIYRITAQPCAVDPWIAVQAFWAYSPTLIWSLLKPDPLDMAFDRAGRRHTAIRRRRMRVDRLHQLPEPTKPGVGLAMFTGAQVLQRIGWYLLIADATTDFLVNWTSMAYTWSGCLQSPHGNATAKCTYNYMGGGPNDMNPIWVGDDADYDHPGYATPSTAAIHAPGPKTVMAAIAIEIEPHRDAPGQVKGATLLRKTDGRQTQAIPCSVSGTGPGMVHISAADSLPGGNTPATTWQVQLHTTGGIITCRAGKLMATGAPAAGLEFDP